MHHERSGNGRVRSYRGLELNNEYLGGFAAVRGAGEGSDGAANLAPLEEAEAAGGRRGGGGDGKFFPF